MTLPPFPAPRLKQTLRETCSMTLRTVAWRTAVFLLALSASAANGSPRLKAQEPPPDSPAPTETVPPEDRPVAKPAPAELVSPPTPEVVRGKMTAWLAARGKADEATANRLAQLWTFGEQVPTPEELFQRTIATFQQFDPEVQRLVSQCDLTSATLAVPMAPQLERAADGAFFTANLSLFFGHYLVQRQLYDEALALLETVSLAEVVDPATLLFCKAVCQHHLLQKEPGLATIDQLLKNTTGVPLRYATLAGLMQYDLQSLQDKSLDEVARRMFDVERRLSLARTGEKVQKREEEIITQLDEIIKKIEEQQGGGGGSGGNSNKSSAPAQDSVVKGSTGPGNVDPKKFKNTGEWGDLPPKERSKAKEDIARKFGAHYAEAVEKFNLKQAGRPARKAKP